jgi:hypothetical protein
MPPVAPTPEGSNPKKKNKSLGMRRFVVGKVVGLTRSFQRMLEALINRLDRDDARVSIPNEYSQCDPTDSGSILKEIEKVKFPSSWVPWTT